MTVKTCYALRPLKMIFFGLYDDSDTPDWQRVQTNHLSVLGDNGDGLLNIVGEVRNFAPNENIRSARFMGERGFVVTFRNVDPLFPLI